MSETHCRTIVFVACVTMKRQQSAPARDLYISPWFTKARRFAEQKGDAWYILSARYGLVEPDQQLAPYEQSLNTMQRQERRRWAAQVWRQIIHVADVQDRLVFLAGQRYRELITPVLSCLGYTVETPLQGLGIGQQLARFDELWAYVATEVLPRTRLSEDVTM